MISQTTASSENPFAELDNAGITPFHWKIMFVSGMGFFTDAARREGNQPACQPDHQHGDYACHLAVAAFPGYLVAAIAMDRLGRKPIQAFGFLLMGAAFAAIALLPGGSQAVIPFVLLYGISYFFAEFGPNTTTFVSPAEIFPARIRTTSHGITATSGKIGAFVGTFAFSLLMEHYGLQGAMGTFSVVAVLGLLVTWLFLPEPKGESLEEISRDDLLRIEQTEQRRAATAGATPSG